MTEGEKQKGLTCVGYFLAAADTSHHLVFDPELCEPVEPLWPVLVILVEFCSVKTSKKEPGKEGEKEPFFNIGVAV